MTRFIKANTFLLLLMWCAQVHALGEVEFSQGVTWYKQGNFTEALKSFLAAGQVGMDEPRLDFNLALCHLKLAQYEQARDSFERAAVHMPLQGLAYFNIGLLELDRGNREEARKWFIRVRDTANETKLRALAEQRLVQMEQATTTETELVRWDNGYRLHIGYDDNIEDPALIGVSNKGDTFANAMAYLARSNGDDEGYRLAVVAFMQHYQTVSMYDLDMLQLSLDKGFVTGEWRNRVGADYEHTTLGGINYLQTTKLYLSSRFSLSNMDDLRLRYRYSDIGALKQTYDYLAGNRHEVELRWSHQGSDLHVQAGYEYELNDRNDYRGTTVFSSYSPTRHTIDLRADKQIATDWTLDTRATWRASLFNDSNILPDSSSVKRSDERLMLSLGISHALSDGLDIGFEYKFTENHSNIDIYHYRRNIYTVDLSGTF